MKWCNKKKHTQEFVDMKIHYRTKEMIRKPKCVTDYNRLFELIDGSMKKKYEMI